MDQVLLLTPGVADHVEVPEVGLAADQVIYDAALGIREEGQGARIVGEALDVPDDQTLHELDPVLAMHLRLQHVGNVEHPTVGAYLVVGGGNADLPVLHGHRVPRKFDHFAPLVNVVVVQDGLLQGGHGRRAYLP